jgi:adenylate kinase
MKRLVILGPPGAGKGTQAARISDRYNIPTISTGDIFRANIDQGTDLGRKVEPILEAGDYVPDDLTNALVADRLGWEDTVRGFLLDGYPRTQAQVHALDEVLANQGTALDGVLELAADTDELVARLLNRAHEQGRADDNEETIRNRMDVYAEQTSPLVTIYRERGLLLRVDGAGDIDEISERIYAALDEL